MSDIRLQCPHCQQSLEAPPDMAGMTIECPACTERFRIPGTGTATTAQDHVASGGAPVPERAKAGESTATERHHVDHSFVLKAGGIALILLLLSLGVVFVLHRSRDANAPRTSIARDQEAQRPTTTSLHNKSPLSATSHRSINSSRSSPLHSSVFKVDGPKETADLLERLGLSATAEDYLEKKYGPQVAATRAKSEDAHQHARNEYEKGKAELGRREKACEERLEQDLRTAETRYQSGLQDIPARLAQKMKSVAASEATRAEYRQRYADGYRQDAERTRASAIEGAKRRAESERADIAASRRRLDIDFQRQADRLEKLQDDATSTNEEYDLALRLLNDQRRCSSALVRRYGVSCHEIAYGRARTTDGLTNVQVDEIQAALWRRAKPLAGRSDIRHLFVAFPDGLVYQVSQVRREQALYKVYLRPSREERDRVEMHDGALGFTGTGVTHSPDIFLPLSCREVVSWGKGSTITSDGWVAALLISINPRPGVPFMKPEGVFRSDSEYHEIASALEDLTAN